MPLSSIHTNRAALQALQSVNAASRDLGTAQKRVSTGFAVTNHKDNGAVFSIATHMRADVNSWETIGSNLRRMMSVTDVAISGSERISDLLVELRKNAVALQDNMSETSRKAIVDHMGALIREIDLIARTSEFDGINLLTGYPTTTTTNTKTYALPSSRLAQPNFPSMAALPPGAFSTTGVRTEITLPEGTRTPASFVDALNTITGNNSQTVTVDAGDTAGRVSLLLDAYGVPDVVEIWQGNTRVAASGQPYAPDGAEVPEGKPVSYAHVVTFDYDPAKGQDLEFRFNENRNATGTAWRVGGLVMGDPASGPPAPTTIYHPTGSLQATAIFETPPAFADPEEVARALDMRPEGVAKVYSVDAGQVAGRIDMLFDAFGTPDTMEVWQGNVRIAASGQSYNAAGSAVAEGSPITGTQQISFNYDPARGPLEFRFNQGGHDPDSAWAVGAIALYPASAPTSSGSATTGRTQQAGFGPIHVDTFINPEGETQRISSRDMTAKGLGLDTLDFSNPRTVLERIINALDNVNAGAAYFGVSHKAIEKHVRFGTKSSDALEVGIGNLVDADMAKEAARLTAVQIRQQLATQSLSIANQQPQWLLNLFKS